MKLTFNRNYFIGFIILLLIEILIERFFKTGFIRHTLGDYLVVILLYCFVRAFTNLTVKIAAISVLIFAYIVEVLQYLNIVSFLGLSSNKTANIIIGNTFSFSDILAYTFGIITVVLFEKLINK